MATPPHEQAQRRVLVIGIDAFDPNVAEQLMAEGKMPNFLELKKNGGYARLRTTIPPESPVAWTAAATGMNPGAYGIFDFIHRDPQTYVPRLSIAQERQSFGGTSYVSPIKAAPFWRITSDGGIPTTVIRWPATFPPEPVRGKMLSGLGTVDIKGFLNSYRFYTAAPYDAKSEGAEKVVPVRQNPIIETTLFGPLIRKDGSLAEMEKPIAVELGNSSAVLVIDNERYPVAEKNWSGWIRARFRVDLFTEVRGIFKVYLIETEPFQMYATSIQIDPENQVVDITYPKEYGKALAHDIGLFYTLGMPEDTKAVTDSRIEKNVFLEQVRQIESEREAMFWHEFRNFTGVYAFAFDSGDRLQHLFWNATGPIPKEVEDYYVDKDRFLGELLGTMGNDTSLIVFSDHGFSSFERAVSINTWLARNGYLTFAKEPTDKDPGGLFANVDWSRTRAYSLGFTSMYINQRGREGSGIVAEKEKEALINELTAKLGNMSDADGRKVIRHLYKGADVYSGNYTADGPDIVVGFEPGYRMSWQNAVGGATPDIIANNTQEWRGDHLIDRDAVPGVVFANFKIRKNNPDLMDIAPTVLRLVGIPPSAMEGNSLVD